MWQLCRSFFCNVAQCAVAAAWSEWKTVIVLSVFVTFNITLLNLFVHFYTNNISYNISCPKMRVFNKVKKK